MEPKARDYIIEEYTYERFNEVAKIKQDNYTPLRIYKTKTQSPEVRRLMGIYAEPRTDPLQKRVDKSGFEDALCYLRV